MMENRNKIYFSPPPKTKTEISKNPTDIENNIKIVKRIQGGRFCSYLAQSNHSDVLYVVKVFPYEKSSPSPFYQNEKQMIKYHHPNIINPIAFQDNKVCHGASGTKFQASTLVMPYAPNGSLYDLLTNKFYKAFSDEKLVRTYLHQLVAGVEFLHSHKIFHLDIKPENIVLSNDFTLKIIDFDMSLHRSSPIRGTLGGGTANYSAPELQNSKVKDWSACDVFSCGIILFALASHGSLPFAEGDKISDSSLKGLMEKPKLFWEKCESSEMLKSEELRELFEGMCQADPMKRMNIE
mmetsp:Transcript_29823/g.27308  ORF Transcript_29823/g.27308 Transcript_29823/m.27308 type:complete len:294 (-) Transcript_29823:260-1141(-)